jgi:hypothetical protein
MSMQDILILALKSSIAEIHQMMLDIALQTEQQGE